MLEKAVNFGNARAFKESNTDVCVCTLNSNIHIYVFEMAICVFATVCL